MNDANNAGTPGELFYRPNRFDDWGYIRTADGKIFAVVRRPLDEEEAARHRRDKTDPFEPLSRALMSALSTPNAPVEREAIARALCCPEGCQYPDRCCSLSVQRLAHNGKQLDAVLAVRLDEATIRKDEREKCAKILDARVEVCKRALQNPKMTESQLDCWAELSNENLDNARAIRGKQP